MRVCVAGAGPAPPICGERMKTYAIEIERVKAISHVPGLLELQVDALVQAAAPRDEGKTSSSLMLSEENARVLYTLLRQQLGEIDKRKGRSQR